ncbi:MAG: hypothetical protein ACR2NN_25965 [Bryobacteraceae bacterium]
MFPRLIVIYAFLFSSLSAADSSLTASVSSSPVPPGGTAQISITLPFPVPLVHGTLSVDVDAAVFGSISAINVFSASGDHAGIAQIQGHHADLFFTSNSGGVGRLPGLPVAEITLPVLATATAGATGQVTLQSKSPWRDIPGNQYTMSFQSPGVAIGDGMSIQSVVPGGGPLPAGTVVQINGQGFRASTALQLEGVSWSNLRLVSPGLLTFILTGPADLTGKLLVLTDSKGSSSRYYSSLTPSTVNRDAGVPAGIQPIFPRIAYVNATFSSPWFAFENDTLGPVEVVLSSAAERYTHDPPPPPNRTITIPAGGISIGDYFGGNSRFQFSNIFVRSYSSGPVVESDRRSGTCVPVSS